MRAEGIGHVHGYWLGRPGRLAAALSVLTGSTMSLSAHARDIFTETTTIDVLTRRATFIAVCTEQGLHHLRGTLRPNHSSGLRLVRHGLLPEEMAKFKTNRDVSVSQVVAIGRLVEKKGFDVLLHAFRQIIERFDNARLTIIGDGPLEESLKALTGQLALDNSVTFAGWLVHNEAIQKLQCAGMIVVPSVIAADGDRDGVPNVILEAFACGIPVVASCLPGIAEAVEHEISGLLADPGDSASLAEAICRVLGDHQLAEKLSHNGCRVLQERFDAMANSGQLAALFAEAMPSP